MAGSSKKIFTYVAGVVLLAALYFGTAVLGLKFDAVSGFATLVWPPTGIAVAVLFMYGERYWPGVFLGALLANYFTGAPLAVAAGIGAGNAAEALLAALMLRKSGFRPRFARVRDVILYIGAACTVATFVSATVGVTSLWLGGIVTPAAALKTWFAWWLGDMLGAYIVGRLLILLIDARRRGAAIVRGWEAAGLLVLDVAVAAAAFADPFGLRSAALPLVFLVILPRLLIAFRLAQVGTAISTTLVTLIAVWGTVHGHGPFARESLAQSLFWIDLYIGASSVATVLVAATDMERKDAELKVRAFNKDLEKKVAERTAQLSKVNDQLEQAKQSLDKRRAVLQSVLHAIGEGVTAVDAAGNPIMVNPAAAKMIGMEPSEALFPLEKMSERFPAFFPDGKTPVPLVDLPLTKALRGESTVNERMLIRTPRKPQGVMVSVTGSPISDDKGNIIGGVAVFREIPGGDA